MRLQGDGLLDSQCGHGRALGHNTLQHRRLGIARLCGAFVRYVRRAGMATNTTVHDGEAEPGALLHPASVRRFLASTRQASEYGKSPLRRASWRKQAGGLDCCAAGHHYQVNPHTVQEPRPCPLRRGHSSHRASDVAPTVPPKVSTTLNSAIILSKLASKISNPQSIGRSSADTAARECWPARRAARSNCCRALVARCP
jgi:hypothetical protein